MGMSPGEHEELEHQDGVPRKSEEVMVRVWANSDDSRIRISLPGGRITTIADDGGERSHRHLYKHLRELLHAKGKWPEPGPRP